MALDEHTSRPPRQAMRQARIDTVNAATCTRCHNESSPNYKTFIYNALIGLVHRRG